MPIEGPFPALAEEAVDGDEVVESTGPRKPNADRAVDRRAMFEKRRDTAGDVDRGRAQTAGKRRAYADDERTLAPCAEALDASGERDVGEVVHGPPALRLRSAEYAGPA